MSTGHSRIICVNRKRTCQYLCQPETEVELRTHRIYHRLERTRKRGIAISGSPSPEIHGKKNYSLNVKKLAAPRPGEGYLNNSS